MHRIGARHEAEFSPFDVSGPSQMKPDKLAKSVHSHTIHRMEKQNTHTKKTAAGQAQGLRVPSRTVPERQRQRQRQRLESKRPRVNEDKRNSRLTKCSHATLEVWEKRHSEGLGRRELLYRCLSSRWVSFCGPCRVAQFSSQPSFPKGLRFFLGMHAFSIV